MSGSVARGRRAVRGVMLLAASALAGCAVGPNYHTPSMRVPGQYVALAGASQSKSAPAAAPSANLGAWWRALGDPELDSLIQRAAAGSPSVIVALDRLQAARI